MSLLFKEMVVQIPRQNLTISGRTKMRHGVAIPTKTSAQNPKLMHRAIETASQVVRQNPAVVPIINIPVRFYRKRERRRVSIHQLKRQMPKSFAKLAFQNNHGLGGIDPSFGHQLGHKKGQWKQSSKGNLHHVLTGDNTT